MPLQQGFAESGPLQIYTTIERSAVSDRHLSPVLLINGSGSTSVMWSRALIDPLLESGHPVIRFDLRDIGRSSRVPSMETYTLEDLAADALAVLDHWDVDRAHFLGRSMGGAVALEAALAAPARVLSLTLVYSSGALAASEDGLPGPDDRVVGAMEAAMFEPPPRTAEERVARRVSEAELVAGTRHPFDRDSVRAEAEADVEHATHSDHGHSLAVANSISRTGDLARVGQLTLVLHGTSDPVVPIEHGRLLAERIPRATLVEYEGLGHEMPPAFCTEVASLVVEHLADATA